MSSSNKGVANLSLSWKSLDLARFFWEVDNQIYGSWRRRASPREAFRQSNERFISPCLNGTAVTSILATSQRLAIGYLGFYESMLNHKFLDSKFHRFFPLVLKVAFSQGDLWKYILLRFFFNFSSRLFDRACDWLGVEIRIQISQSQAPSKNLEEKLKKNQRSVYFHKPFREKTTFTLHLQFL